MMDFAFHVCPLGGLTPGSMPPNSTHINQEGAIFKSFKIVNASKFQEDELKAKFEAPAQHPGCTGSRNLHDNIADLRAQIAANQRGISLVTELIEEYSFDTVQKYMGWIQKAAEESVRALLKDTVKVTCHSLILYNTRAHGQVELRFPTYLKFWT